MAIRARWLTSIDDLTALGPRYDAMVLAAGDIGLFYQLGWLERVWPYFEMRLGGVLSFLVVEQDGELVALAPLVFKARGWAHARQRVLGFMGGTWDELDNWMPGFLFATRDTREQSRLMNAMVDALAERQWDLLDLRFVRSTCPSIEVLRTRFSGLRAIADPMATPRANLDEGWAQYWSGRSKRLLRILDRGRKRAAEDHVDLVHEITSDIPDERRREAETMHLARQDQIRSTGRERSSPFEDPVARRVFWSLIDFAVSRGQLRAHWLRLGDHVVAYVIALHHAGTTFGYFNAIDPAAERYHPGSLILAGLIEREASEHAAIIVDMMMGANLTKTLFATETLVNTNVTIVNPQLRSKVSDAWSRAAHQVAERLRR